MERNAKPIRGIRHATRALNSSAEGSALRAFCFQLPEAIDGKLPEWIPYMPAPDAQGRVVGEDGRSWLLKNPRALAASWKRKLPVDVNHANDIKAPRGEESPAYGHIVGFEVRGDNTTWANVEWNPLGTRAINNREYAFISPAFDHPKTRDEITAYAGASLVNHPKFPSLALNSRQSNEEATMLKAILAALDLDETATEEKAVRAINAKKDELQRAINARDTPDLQRFVPRADYDAVNTRATNAEQKLADAETKTHKDAVDAEITAASKAGKITPATESYHRATCATKDGLEAFRAYVKAAPEIAAATSGLDGKPAPTKGKQTDPNELATRALNFQKKEADAGRSISIAAAMTAVTSQEQ